MTTIGTVLADSGWHRHWWIWAPFFWTFWLALAFLLFWTLGLGARLRRRGDERSAGRAQAILAERYARGEICADEYRDRLAGLEQAR
jgi:uncharacterized membrane protein